jgi:hypothetical protein
MVTKLMKEHQTPNPELGRLHRAFAPLTNEPPLDARIRIIVPRLREAVS